MGIFWPCDLLVRLGVRRKRRATDVTCETLVGVEPGHSVTYKKKSWQRKNPGIVSSALTRLRDVYVNLMVNAADKGIGDMSTLVYGNGYSGSEFRFDSPNFDDRPYISSTSTRRPSPRS